MNGITIGYGLCGSFCTFDKSLAALKKIRAEGVRILPMLSFNAAALNTRFGTAASFRVRLEEL
ncbi:MAG: dipicolinate synthase subunit B, partial [Pygmaiobacter sp.]